MKKTGITLFVLSLSLVALAQDIQLVAVTGDRVSLRAAPKPTAVLLDRAMIGDQLLLVDNSNPEWVGVRPPQKIDLWVNADYIRDDVVLPARLNVRSGPSRSHGVVAIVSRGEELTIRGKLDGWVRIAPPEKAVVWISRQYTDVSPLKPVLVDPVKPLVLNEEVLITGTEAPAAENDSKIVITVESPKPEIPEAEAEIVRQVMNELLNTQVEAIELPEVLEADPGKEQGVEEQFTGILQPANALLYKLVDSKFERIVICYVRGNSEQMAAYVGQSLALTGRAYWAANLDQPFLVPEKIEVLSETPVE